MSLKCGIVGLPNVGKSTLFNALTKAGIAAENYPFCTIEPNVGIVEVPDPRLAALAAIAKPQKVIPATVEFVDIAGLVAGASKGEGLGNQFLANDPRDRCDRARRPLLRGSERRPRRRQDRSARRHRDDQYRAGAGRSRGGRQADHEGREARARRRRQGSAARVRRAFESARGVERGEAGANRRPLRRRARAAEAVLPADDEADALRRERRRARLREQSDARRAPRARRDGERAGRRDQRGARVADRRSRRATTRRCSSTTWG